MPQRPIREILDALGLSSSDAVEIGGNKAKIAPTALEERRTRMGRLVLVSAITPTARGEGKTMVSIALAMALCRLGRRAVVCLRQPSMGPVFGAKGGATGGGASSVEPSGEINLHFTGDFHAVSAAHNLLAALCDNDLHFQGRLDPRRITWPRVVDLNDRALRHIVVGLGGPAHGVPRETRFDITAASEIMAVLCLARSAGDLRERLGRIVVGRTNSEEPITASDLGAVPALEMLLESALAPNVVQTSEGTPALVHGGPFANIAHGCSSVLSTRLALALAEDVVTEAGFGFDLGGEKFLHLKCPVAGAWPGAVVLVATLRALARPGGWPTAASNRAAIEQGLSHLDRQVQNSRAFGLEPIVALNVFAEDANTDLDFVQRRCEGRGLLVARVTSFEAGSSGALDLATKVAASMNAAPETLVPRALYTTEDSFHDKLRKIARTLYGARDVILSPAAARDVERFVKWGYGALPPCIAKTPLSLSGDPAVPGVPPPCDLPITSARLSAGAGFLVALAGDVQTMPGLPRDPPPFHLDDK